MLDGQAVVAALRDAGVTHAVWIPDTELGTWDSAFAAAGSPVLVRVCREGEAFAIAAGLWMGGKKPIVILQCTGLFEAGDSLRNVLYDMSIPLFMVVGVRNYYTHKEGKTTDTCPVYTEPIMRAWSIPYVVLENRHTAADLVAAYRQAQSENRVGAVLLAE
jgi:sulfopyruvate decarboxylase subunit alpha